MTGPLRGLRVLDAASLYAAPAICSLLADHGADVVKLEPPGGDPYRQFPTRLWALIGRGKRSLVLDLEQEDGRAALHRLVPGIDVVVVNDSAARLGRRGLDPDALLALNPSLVVVRFTGFGLEGPYADRPSNGTVAEAYVGLTHVTGRPEQEPVAPSVPLGDAVTALTGAFGVLAACYEQRVHGGPGQVVDVNLADAVLQVVSPLFAQDDGTGEPPGRLAGALPGALLRGAFATADGGWVAVSVSTVRQLRTLAELVGDGGLVSAAAPDVDVAVRGWLGGLPREEALDRLVGARIPVSPVNTARDLAADPHARARGLLRTVTTVEHGPVTVPAPAPRLRADPRPADEVLAAVGEHTAEVLRDWGQP